MNEQLKVIISAEVEKLKKGVADAQNQVKSFKEEVDKASKNVDENFKSMGTGIANGAKAFTGAVVAGGAALLALGESSKEYRNEQAKLVTAFETAGASADTAKNTYNDLYRVLGDTGQATEAANHLAKLTTEEKALNEWTNICQGVYATFGASLPIEGLTEAANETAKVGTVTGSLADALNWAGISEDAFNEKLAACNTEAEREKLIRDTLSKTYDEAAAKYEKNNEEILKQNESQTKLNDAMAKLGEVTTPIMTMLTELGTTVLSAITPYLKDFAENYLPTIKDVLSDVGDKLATAFDWASQHKEVLAAIAIVIGTVVTAIGLYNAVAAIKAAMAVAEVTTVWGLVAAYAAQAAAMIVAIAPYALIVAAIAAVIAIIVVCVKHWDEIKAKVKEVWENIKQKTAEAKEAVVGKFNEIKSNITNKVEAVRTSVKNTFDKVKTAITQPIEKARDSVKNIVDKIKGFFKFEWSLPKLKVPKFSITPQGWKVGDLLQGSIPKLGVTWNARGGVFDSPTIMGYGNSLQGLGEAGAEAVVPLENNLEWLDKLATMLDARLASRQPTVLMVDKRVLGEVTVEGINDITKQTGNLPLVIA